MENSLRLFDYSSQPVRASLIEDDLWFVAKDVCEALGLTWKGADSIRSTPNAWRGVHKLWTPSGTQELTIISEPAVYKLAFRSRKPEAELFVNWVVAEVLPAIRKTGRFDAQASAPSAPKTSPDAQTGFKAFTNEPVKPTNKADLHTMAEEACAELPEEVTTEQVLELLTPIFGRSPDRSVIKSVLEGCGYTFDVSGEVWSKSVEADLDPPTGHRVSDLARLERLLQATKRNGAITEHEYRSAIRSAFASAGLIEDEPDKREKIRRFIQEEVVRVGYVTLNGTLALTGDRRTPAALDTVRELFGELGLESCRPKVGGRRPTAYAPVNGRCAQ